MKTHRLLALSFSLLSLNSCETKDDLGEKTNYVVIQTEITIQDKNGKSLIEPLSPHRITTKDISVCCVFNRKDTTTYFLSESSPNEPNFHYILEPPYPPEELQQPKEGIIQFYIKIPSISNQTDTIEVPYSLVHSRKPIIYYLGGPYIHNGKKTYDSPIVIIR